MASRPGILTDWPWKPLGSFKYIILGPWITESIYSILVKDAEEWDLFNLTILPLILWRALHQQLWNSLSRYRAAQGTNRIVDKAIEFDQVDRESNWNRFDNIKLQTWAIPKYKLQYHLKRQKESIENLIEEAVLEANEKGASVLSHGLMNQASILPFLPIISHYSRVVCRDGARIRK
ncbi:hypothetical protein V6N13_033233 [Hibiscus sabdariffa]